MNNKVSDLENSLNITRAERGDFELGYLRTKEELK